MGVSKPMGRTAGNQATPVPRQTADALRARSVPGFRDTRCVHRRNVAVFLEVTENLDDCFELSIETILNPLLDFGAPRLRR